MLRILSLLLCLTLSFCFSFSFAQSIPSDSSFLATATKNINNLYQTTIDAESHLYNGSEYIDPDKSYITGHPFFKSNQEVYGWVLYDEVEYPQITLQYDLVSDQVVIFHPTSGLSFMLVPEKVKSFSLASHTFIRLVPDSLSGSPVRPGFYDLLVPGKTQVLAKRIKRISEKATYSGMEGEFLEKNKFYIKKNNAIYEVKTKRSVLNLFPEQKKELQKYIRTGKVNFNSNREKAIVQLIQFYNTLPSS